MDKIDVAEIQKEINYFSFTEVIQKGNYIGQSWKERESFISCNKGCCTRCEKCGEPVDSAYVGFRLNYVSHGSHALDFCESMHIEPDDTWSDTPVLLLFENPSIQYGNLYGKAVAVGGGKRPAQKWYWLHDGYNEGDTLDYPKYYRQGCYGDLVASLIKTFRLRNAYMTNFVKCAMNDADAKHYLGTTFYQEACISNCFNNVLLKEIEILTNHFQQELVVFAFSQRVRDLVQCYFSTVDGLKYSLCLMPHPASRLANEYRKYVIFGKVYKTLSNKGINCESALKEFREKDTSDSVNIVRFTEDDREALIKDFTNEGITIKDKKISHHRTGTVTLFPREVKCKFKLADGIFEFGYVFGSDDPFWIWDGNKRTFLNTAEEVSEEFGKLFNIFHDRLSGSEQDRKSNLIVQ
jgi:hypothetical protein